MKSRPRIILLALVATAIGSSSDWTTEQRAEFIRETKQCGPVALYLALAFYGERQTIEEIASKCPVTKEGSSLQDLVEYLNAHGYPAKAVRMKPSELWTFELPFIAVLRTELTGTGPLHFVFIPKVTKDYVWYLDNMTGGKFTVSKFIEGWTGEAILIPPRRSTALDARILDIAPWWIGLVIVAEVYVLLSRRMRQI